MKVFHFRTYLILGWVLFFAGCATIFGWNIHAPGLHSKNFYSRVATVPERVGLYLTPETFDYESKERGGKLADPQTYYLGESFAPMAVEAFQREQRESKRIALSPRRSTKSLSDWRKVG